MLENAHTMLQMLGCQEKRECSNPYDLKYDYSDNSKYLEKHNVVQFINNIYQSFIDTLLPQYPCGK